MTEIRAIQSRVGPATAKRLKRLISRAERYFKISANSEVSVVFVPTVLMRQLNQRYRGKPRPTTTLSFSQQTGMIRFPNRVESKSLVGRGGPLTLGEIFLCLPEIKKYARLSQMTIDHALDELTLHSFLHLLGYHHSTSQGQKKMDTLSQKIISLA